MSVCRVLVCIAMHVGMCVCAPLLFRRALITADGFASAQVLFCGTGPTGCFSFAQQQPWMTVAMYTLLAPQVNFGLRLPDVREWFSSIAS